METEQLFKDHYIKARIAAEHLGISRETLRKLRDGGFIKAILVGKQPRYSVNSIKRFAKERLFKGVSA